MLLEELGQVTRPKLMPPPFHGKHIQGLQRDDGRGHAARAHRLAEREPCELWPSYPDEDAPGLRPGYRSPSADSTEPNRLHPFPAPPQPITQPLSVTPAPHSAFIGDDLLSTRLAPGQSAPSLPHTVVTFAIATRTRPSPRMSVNGSSRFQDASKTLPLF